MNYKLILRTILTVLLTTVLAGAAEAQVSLRFDPENGTVGMEESRRLGIYLDDLIDVRTIELTVQYDDELLASLGGGKGALFDALPPGTQVWQNLDDDTPGEWSGYALVFGQGTVVTGPGELFYWDVEGLYPGEAAITTVSVALYDAGGAPIADVTLDGTTLTVVPPIDDPVLDPMPEYHPGTSNTPAWNDVGATEYQVQISPYSGFGTILDDSGWISGTSHEFTGLTDGVPYYYRVRARLDAPAYETDWSSETVSSIPDDTGPQSAVAALAPFQTSLTFDVPWSGSDAGSGLDRVELYVNGTLYTTDNNPDAGQPFSFTAPAEGAYEFYTVAFDGVNNQEEIPVTADASTMVDVTAPSGGLVVNGGATVTPDQVVALASSVIDAVEMRYTNTENDFSAPESQWQTYADDLPWTLTSGDGLKTVYGEYRDEAGNVLQLQDEIELDQTPPADSLVINDDDTYTSSTAVILTMAGSDAQEMRFTNIDGDWTAPASSWQPYAATVSWTVPATEGELTVHAEYRDEAGNVSPASDTIIFDSLPPTADFVINGGDAVTNDPFVDLTISGSDAVEMRFRNESGSYGAWQPFDVALADWELEAGDGPNTVFGQFRDAAGNELEVAHAITLDTTPPTAAMVINGDAVVTSDPAVTLDITWDDAAEMRFSNDGSVFSEWETVATPVNWTLTGSDGTQTVHAEFRDAAGNVLAITDSIELDTTPPAGAMLINNGDQMATDLNVMMTSVISGAIEMRFSNDNTTWSSWVALDSPYAWLLEEHQGSHTVYGQYRDAAGNVLDLQDSITVDSEAPEGSFVINNGDDLTNSAVVTLTSSVSGAVEMRFTNISGDWGAPQSYWRSYALGQTWTLDEVEGERVVYAQYRDTAGNILDVQDSIVLDTIGPEASFVINGDAPKTNDPAATLDITPGDAVLMQFSNDGSTYSGWQAVDVSLDWDIEPVEGERTVFGRFQDQAGNITEASDLITLDTTAPVATLVINDDDAVTNQLTVDLVLTAPDAVEMRFRTGSGSYGAWEPFAATVTFDLDDVQGEQTVQGEFRDDAGNVSETSDTIVYDTSAPTGSFVINDDDAYTNSLDVTLTSAVSDAVNMQFSNDGVTYDAWEPYAATKTWTIAGTDGVLTVYGRYEDAAGNVLQAQDAIELDTMPPPSTLLINNDDPGTISFDVTLNSNAPEAVEMRFHNEGESFGAWVPFQDAYSWTLNPAQGSQMVTAEYRDTAGNVSVSSDAIIVDTIAPDAVIVINGGDELTNSAQVLITNTVTGADFMRFRNESGAFGAWEDLASTRIWILDGGDGLHTVYAQFQDEYGNVTETTDSITLDATAPVASFVINNDEPLTSSQDVILNIELDGATEMQFRNEGGTWSGFQPVADTLEWQLPAGDGPQTVQGQFRDEAGNIQQTQDAITLDTIGPEASFVINGDAPKTNDPAATLDITPGDAVLMQFSNDGATYSGWQPVDVSLGWDIEPVEGERTVFGRFQDQAGNITEASDLIILDTTAPAATLVINDDDAVTNQLTVDLVLTAPDAVEMRFRTGSGSYGAWEPFATTATFDLDDFQGEQTVLGEFRDDAGNVSETSDTIVYDTSAPTGSFVINDDDAYTNSLDVTLTSAVSDAVNMQFSNDGVTYDAWEPYAATKTWAMAGTDGVLTVYGRYEDAAGNVLQAQDTIELDTSDPGVAFVINNDDEYTASTLVTLSITGSDAAEMQFANAGDAYGAWQPFAAELPWELPAADGLQTVNGRFRDAAGNVTDTSDSITLDTTAPAVPVLAGEPAFTPGTANTLSWNAVPESTYLLQRADDTGFSNGVVESGWIADTSFEFTGLTDGSTYHYRVKAKDALDNETDWSGAEFSTQDATAPASTAGALATYQTGLEFEVSWSGSDATSGLAQVELFVDDGSGPVSVDVITDPVSPGIFSFTAPGDGTYSFHTVATDAVGLVEDAPAEPDAVTTVDTAGPGASFVINDDDEYTASAQVTLYITGGDATEMQFANAGGTYGDWLPIAPTLAWEINDEDGEQTVYGRFRDAAGNVVESGDAIILDTTPPDVPVLAAEPGYTAGLANNLSWSPVPGSTYLLQRADDAGFSAGVAESGWIAGTAFEFTGLTDGSEYFYRVKARDALENETDWSGVESSTQDATAPASAAGALAAYQTGLEFEVPWSGSDATSGLAQVELFVDDGSGPVSAAIISNPVSPGVFIFTAPGDGTYSFHTVATDHAGLVEAAPAGPDATTTVDTGLPEGGFVINDDQTWATSPEVVLTIAVSEAQEMRFRNLDGAWSDWEAYTDTRNWTLEDADGLQTVEGEFRDAAGNVLATSDDIQLDTQLPEGLMAINGGAGVTSSVMVVLNHSVTGTAEMRHSNNGTDWTDWAMYAADLDWELTPGDGLKTVHGEFRDEAGNTLALTDTIELDTTAPEVPVMEAEPLFTMGLGNEVSWTGEGEEFLVQAATSPAFDSGLLESGWIAGTTHEFTGLTSGQIYYYRVSARDAQGNISAPSAAVFSTQDADQPVATATELDPYRNTTDITVEWSGSDAISGLAMATLYVDDGSGWVAHTTTSEVDPAEPFTFTAPGDGPYSFQVVATDVAGNIESVGPESEATTLVDQVLPEGMLAINAGEESTSTVDVTLHSAVTDALPITGMRFTNEDGVWPGGPDSWLPYAETLPWVLDEGDGTQTVFAEYRDAAGNILAILDTIELDTTPPGVPVLTAEPVFTPGDANTLYWEAVDAVAYFLQSSEEEDFNTIAANSGWVTDLEHTFGDLTDGQTYYYRIRARDALENETGYSEIVSSTQDATAPTSAAAALDPYQALADITVLWSGEDLTSGLATVRLYVNDGMGWELAGETTEVETPVPFVYTAEEAGEYSFYTVAVDQVGNEEDAPAAPDAVTLVDFSAPSPATDLHSEPGHEAINLSWANPDDEDVAATEIWAALWADSEMVSTYPEYDDIAPAPERPGSRAAAATSEQWVLIQTLDPGVTSFIHSEGMPSRGVYFYEIFVRDLAGNYSAQVPVNDKATNYRLGDVDNNHVIDVFDITQLGATYGSADGDAAYNNELDVGPTDDNSGYGVPTTDSEIGFEDLAIMALNYLPSKAAVPEEGSSEPALTWYQKDENTWVLGLTEPCASLQAIHLRLELPPEVTATVAAGEILDNEPEYFLGVSAREGLDAGLAMLGQGRVIPGDGELLVVTTSSELDLQQVHIEARDAQNASLAIELSDEPIQVLPAMYKLANNYPNPFNPQTTISFDLPEPQPVRLVIYDLRGRQVRELVSGPMEAGFHSVVWDGTGQQGRRMASGVYFYRISAGPLQDTRRMMLVK